MKNCLLSLMMLISFSASFAQDFPIGAIAGLNISNVVGPEPSIQGNKSRTGGHFGVYSRLDINDKLAVRPEVLFYSGKGTASGDYRASYLDIPVMLSYNIIDELRLNGGLQFSFLYRARVSDETGRDIVTQYIRKMDAGLVFGGTYELQNGLGFALRLARGISRVGADGQQATFNFVTHLSVTYLIVP